MPEKIDDETIQRALDGDHMTRLSSKDHKIIRKYLKKKKLEGVYTLDEATNEYVKHEAAKSGPGGS
jgi:hypothetical protein